MTSDDSDTVDGEGGRNEDENHGAMDVDVDGIKRETTSLSEVEESSKRGDNNRDSDSSDSDILIDEDKTKVKKKSSIKIKLQHIPVFCYIGLVLCKEPVLLSDLIRWCEQGQLPYYKANEVLPEDMKFSGTDIKIYCSNKQLGHHPLLSVTHKVLNVLGIQVPVGCK